MIEIQIDSRALQVDLQRLTDSLRDLTPALQLVVNTLHDEAIENFEQEGRPAWSELSPVTTLRREQRGTAGRKLQESGQLRASIQTEAGPAQALIGTSKVYAAMQQFGGRKADFPHLWGDIPARPFLPITADGTLQPEAEQAVLDEVLHYLGRVI